VSDTIATLAATQALINKTYNGLTISPSTGGLVIGNGKSLTASSTLTLIGTDSTVMTFPSTNASVARIDAGQTFTGTNTFGPVNLNAGGALAGTFSGAPTLSGSNFITLGNLVQSTAGAQFLALPERLQETMHRSRWEVSRL